MSYSTVEISKKKIILLSGFERACGANKLLPSQPRTSLKRSPRDIAMRSRLVTSQACGCPLHRSRRGCKRGGTAPSRRLALPHVALDAPSVTCRCVGTQANPVSGRHNRSSLFRQPADAHTGFAR